MNVRIIHILLLLVLFNTTGMVSGQYRTNDKALKYYKDGNLYELMRFSKEMDPDEISFQFKIYGKASMEYGFYEKAWKFYQKTALLDAGIFNEKDVLNYYYCLLKCGQEKSILKDSLFNDVLVSSRWVEHVVKVAKSREYYRELKLEGLKNKELEASGLLPQYGITFYDDYLFFAFDKNADQYSDAKLKENLITNLRWKEKTNIGRVRLNSSGGIGLEGTSIQRMPVRRRVVTLYKAQKSKDEFFTVVPGNGEPEMIQIKGDRYPQFPYNSRQYACAMPYLDEQKSRLYFCSTMPGGLGSWDIYYTDFDGLRWGEPINAGDQINTPYDELFPSVKDSLLFFSSDGREGLGGFDNYVYIRNKGETVNFFPVNTIMDDMSFQIAGTEPFRGVGIQNKKAFYFASSKNLCEILKETIDSIGSERSTLPNKMIKTKKKESAVLPITVNENTAKTSLQVSRQLLDIEQPEPVFTAKTSMKKQEEVKRSSSPISVVSNDEIALMHQPIEPEHQPVLEEEIILPPKDKAPLFLNAPVAAVKSTDANPDRMGEIYFDVNSPVIKSSNYDNLNQIVAKILEQDIKNIVVWGHADRSGSRRGNDYLSFLRAIGVVEYLKNKLGDESGNRIFTVASGEKYARGFDNQESSDRKVVVYNGEVEFPYRLIFAYKAGANETLESIARLFNNDLIKMKEMNAISYMPEDRNILVGIRGVHVVKTGETLYRIAVNYNCDLNTLRKINLKDDPKVVLGEKLFIPLAINE